MIEIREAHPDEYELVGQLTVAAYETLEVSHLWGGYDEAILDTATRAKEADVIVAVRDGRIVGAVTYASDPESHWLEWTEPGEAQFRLLAVDANVRGQGAGEALVRFCMNRAAADSMSLCIHTTKWMPAARRMYERLGFQRRPDRDVDQAHWDDPPVDNLPPEWVGESFLAYCWSP